MPGLSNVQKNDQLLSNENSSCNEIWSNYGDDINYNKLQKFWCELSLQARQHLLRIDKQTLFEQARKSVYCSKCNGLLVEGFTQIVMYGKSLQHDKACSQLPCNRLGGNSKDEMLGVTCITPTCQDETQDLSVHPWGGLVTTKDGALTLLDCYLYSKSLTGLQNVFDSARARERERELLYPNACGGGGRGWISQGIASYGRGHGTRESCALHTTRLSCDTLVDFWSALGEEEHHSLLKMKEEDFIERLMHRFDSKRFCRDCRRNVIREFKELKDLKRMRREPRCTNWFCAADTAFQYEVSNDTIHADWHQIFVDSFGRYHHFEWAVGSGQGKADVLDFENVGMNGSVEVNGLDLDGLKACYITLRAWKLDGRCSEFSVKAHALKGRQCVHCRLAVGDGYVTIMQGESIRRFFEHAEETEEEEDDNSMDKDGNDLDGECSRPQKHAKSPELAREFLLDSAIVIFKEQVEKAFREGTARQNAHSIFVCLVLQLLEERIHVACKEIITLEKQMKLLEEEEKEKRDKEERKERKRNKEREKKLRRKERLKEKDKDKICTQAKGTSIPFELAEETATPCIDEEVVSGVGDSISENGDTNVSESACPEFFDESSSNDYAGSDSLNNSLDGVDEDIKEENGSLALGSLKGPQWILKARRDFFQESFVKWSDKRGSLDNGAVAYKSESRYYADAPENFTKGVNYFSRQSRASATKFTAKNSGPRFNLKAQCSNLRITDKSNVHSCGCNQHNDYKAKVEEHISETRFDREIRCNTKMEPTSGVLKPVHRINKFNQTDYNRDNCGGTRSKTYNYKSAPGRDSPYTKKVWEPVNPQKRCPRSSSDSDVTLRSCDLRDEKESDKLTSEVRSDEVNEKLSRYSQVDDDDEKKFSAEMNDQIGFQSAEEGNDSCLTVSCNLSGLSDFPASSSSGPDNCLSYQSEGDSNTPASNHQNGESSSIMDSEYSCGQSEGRESLLCVNGSSDHHTTEKEKSEKTPDREASRLTCSSSFTSLSVGNHLPWSTPNVENGVASVQPGVLSSMHNPSISFPIFQGPSSTGYYHQNSVPWSTALANGLMSYHHPNPYLLTTPIGYSLNGDSNFLMHYDQVQHMVSPFMNGHQVPIYQPVHTMANILTPQEQTIALEVSRGRDTADETRKETFVSGNHQQNTLPMGGSEKGNLTKFDTRSSGFSLFQFGGPVALPTYQSSNKASDEQKAGELSTCHVADHACSRKDTTIDEYNLFANGIQFSIF